MPEHQQRALYDFCEKGYPDKIADVELPEPAGSDLRWLTYQPAPEPTEADEPVASAKAAGKGKRTADWVEFIVPNPTQHRLQQEGRSHTKRQQRALRGAKTLYAHRVFTAEEGQARGEKFSHLFFRPP